MSASLARPAPSSTSDLATAIVWLIPLGRLSSADSHVVHAARTWLEHGDTLTEAQSKSIRRIFAELRRVKG